MRRKRGSLEPPSASCQGGRRGFKSLLPLQKPGQSPSPLASDRPFRAPWWWDNWCEGSRAARAELADVPASEKVARRGREGERDRSAARQLLELTGCKAIDGRQIARRSVHCRRVRVDVHPSSESARTRLLRAAMDRSDHELTPTPARRAVVQVSRALAPLTREGVMS
jgi:hypothetical protein